MKKQLLEQLLDLTKKQTVALASEDLETFECLMGQKQEIMDQIDTLHRERPELKLEKHEELLREIVVIDQSNRGEFDRQYQEVKGKLTKLRKEQRVAHVYNNPYDVSYEEGVFFDKK
ncbi:MAG: hypothetical protein ACRCTE_13385 [Cellulosilyticaceae bacterium]